MFHLFHPFRPFDLFRSYLGGSSPVVPSNALITGDGIALVTADGQYLITES